MIKPDQMWDMSFDPNASDGPRMSHWGGNVLYGVIGGLCKAFWRFKVINRDSIRAFKGHGCVVVCNHTSFLDVVHIYLSARPAQWPRFMAREDLFDKGGGFLGQAIGRVGAFPVKRDSADRTAIKRAARMLKNNEIVVIMPEGTRRGKGNIEPELHAGAAFIAKMGKTPILPMTVRGAEKIKPEGSKLPRFPKIEVEFGEPLLLEDFDFLPKDQRLDGCSWYAMRQCFALFYQVKPEEVDMKALFPNAYDFAPVFAEHPIPPHNSIDVVAEIEEREAAKAAKAAAAAAPAAQVAAAAAAPAPAAQAAAVAAAPAPAAQAVEPKAEA